MKKFVILLLLAGCSYIIKQHKPKENFTLKKSNITSFCAETEQNTDQLITESHDTQKLYYKVTEKSRLSSIERFVTLALIQMQSRPDLSSPHARLQVIITRDDKVKYFDFTAKKSQSWPYLYGLDYLLKYYGAKKNLESLAQAIDQAGNRSITTGSELHHFLNSKKLVISSNEKLKKWYFHGDHLLFKGETIPRFTYLKLINYYRKYKTKYAYKTNSKLAKEGDDQTESQCNFDIKLYDKSFYFPKKEVVPANTFGIKSRYGQLIMATSGQSFAHRLEESYALFLKGDHHYTPGQFCHFKFDNKAITYIAGQTIDPGQHLYHLSNYHLSKDFSLEKLAESIQFSRYYITVDPLNIFYESHRGNPKHLEKLLEIGISVYHQSKMGKIWAHYQSEKEQSFVMDNRYDGALSCQK